MKTEIAFILDRSGSMGSMTIREETGAKKCFKPTSAVVKDLNTFLRGWSGYFDFG